MPLVSVQHKASCGELQKEWGGAGGGGMKRGGVGWALLLLLLKSPAPLSLSHWGNCSPGSSKAKEAKEVTMLVSGFFICLLCHLAS